jgi:hypothetical protein
MFALVADIVYYYLINCGVIQTLFKIIQSKWVFRDALKLSVRKLEYMYILIMLNTTPKYPPSDRVARTQTELMISE